jgi:O-antigen biosynthesis protein WbqP
VRSFRPAGEFLPSFDGKASKGGSRWRVMREKTYRALTGMSYLKRAFDLVLGLSLLPPLCILMAAIAVVIRATSDGPALYWSDRVGRNNRIFSMPKFRTMRLGAPEMATHLLSDPQRQLTALGPFLRKTSLDELPQIYSILKGDLSFVGPRPALYNQEDLISLRTERGIHELVPGLTGWAQIHGRDQLSIPAKVEFDHEYLKNKTFWLDLKILVLTVLNVMRREGVLH